MFINPPDTPTLTALRAARGAGRRRVRRLAPAGPESVVGYLRVSGEEQKVTGLGLAAQRAAIEADCERRGLVLGAVYDDKAVSGRVPPDKRPGLRRAITDLDNGEATILMVAKVDRLARSVADLALLSRLGERAGWNIVALNAAFDTTTPQGQMMRDMLGLFAQLEAAMGSERMKAVAAIRRARGDTLGHPSPVTEADREHIRALRAQGLSWATVAAAMNQEGRPTPRGARWHPTSCQRAAQQ